VRKYPPGHTPKKVPFRHTPKESRLIELAVEGKTNAEIASIMQTPIRTIEDTKRHNRDVIEQRIEERRLQVHRHAEQHYLEMLDAAAESAKDPENRNQAGQFRNYNDALGLTGKGSIHVGDVHNTLNAVKVNLDPKLVHEFDAEEHARLMSELGLS